MQAHLHLPMQVPDGAALAELKKNDPAAHRMWLKQVERQMEHQRFMESAGYKMPLKVMQSAHRAALTALVVVALIAGIAIWLDRPWLAALFGVIDLVGIVAIFIGSPWDEEDSAATPRS